MHLGAAIVIGVGLAFVFNLEPIWWLAWVLPGLLFALALRTEGWASRGLVALAVLIGVASNFPYLRSVMPLVPAVIVTLLLALLWVFIIGSAKRIVQAWQSGWTVLALPVIAVATDTLLAHFTPDGNFFSLAYSQAGVLPVAQLASLFGVGGILFVVMLVNSALALALTRGMVMPGAARAYVSTLLVVALAVAFGWWRLTGAPGGQSVTFGIASIDDFIAGPQAPQSDAIWARYEAQVAELARGGAHIVLLPEKIAVLPTADAEQRKSWLSDLAHRNHVWLVAGLGVVDKGQRRNEAWWFAPDGKLATNYLKHHMAPPEREFVPGDEYPVNDIGGVRYGVAICKDMHFASLGRGFGARHARVMLVPAWDFNRDAAFTANITLMRGIENGYGVVRSSREGLLSITDAYGRMLARERSATLPGATLLQSVEVGAEVNALYTRIGDALGWSCVAGALAMLLGAYRARRRARVMAELAAEATPSD